MYLIHWLVPRECCLSTSCSGGLTIEHRPVAILKEPYLTSGRFVVEKTLSDDMFPTWKKLEELVDKGKIKNIGVCKYALRDAPACPRALTIDNISPEVSPFGGLNS